MRAIDVGDATPAPSSVAFLDGIQRYAVEGHLGIIPLVRGYVAAAVLRREEQTLKAAASQNEEFLVVPVSRLTPAQHAELTELPLPLYDCTDGERSHPILDVQLAAAVVERRREQLERRLAIDHLAGGCDEWLVVDGSIGDLVGGKIERHGVLGLVKSHDTQFLDGADLEVALTLLPGYRTSVFARHVGGQKPVFTWYLRLWPWESHDLLYGLVRIERAPTDQTVAEASMVSRWLVAERAPLAAPDERWDRLIYPIRQVEEYLQSQVGGWW